MKVLLNSFDLNDHTLGVFSMDCLIPNFSFDFGSNGALSYSPGITEETEDIFRKIIVNSLFSC